MKELMLEDTEICGDCGCEYTTLLPDSSSFVRGFIGRVKCPNCGHEEPPCDICRGCELTDESGRPHNCHECPWKDAEVIINRKENT